MAKISANLNVDDLIDAMAEGNVDALNFIMKMMQTNTEAVPNILFLDKMEIYGSKICVFWTDCCGRDQAKVNETVAYLKKEGVSKEKIHENLNQAYAKPFI